jgi:glycosyltransferase involved in cell wall biosynthesis
MIRVLHFCDLVNRYDFIDNIVQFADPKRFQMGICVRTAHSNIEEPVYTAGTPRWVLPGLSRWRILQTTWKLARILRHWKAHILHTHHFDPAVIGMAATRLSPRTRLVVGRHYSDAIYRSSKGIRQKLLLACERLVNQSAARIVVPSEYVATILTHWQGINPTKISKVPYGFVPDRYSPLSAEEVYRLRGELGLAGKTVLGNFARLHEEKGQRFLLQAITQIRSRFPQLVLLIAGEGPERPALERQIRDSGLEGVVRLLGWRRDAIRLMAAVDAVVQPTLQEAFSQVMAEALWMGKPLVISDVSGVRDLLTDGETGLIVPPGEPTALANALAQLVTDPSLRKRLASAGRAHLEVHFTVDKIVPRYEQVYLAALAAEGNSEASTLPGEGGALRTTSR